MKSNLLVDATQAGAHSTVIGLASEALTGPAILERERRLKEALDETGRIAKGIRVLIAICMGLALLMSNDWDLAHMGLFSAPFGAALVVAFTGTVHYLLPLEVIEVWLTGPQSSAEELAQLAPIAGTRIANKHWHS